MASDGLYVQLFSIHGLIRGEAPELGRDADTGGQVKYVLELARYLAELPEVAQVDLFTRLIRDKTVSPAYAVPIEPLSDKARIVRVQCGGGKYIRKELLWPHLAEFIDKTLKVIKQGGRIPDIFHGHYADGGFVARELANIFGLPFFFTGHSMGRHKKEKLLAEGMTVEEINRRYQIDHRIGEEERVIKAAEVIIVSTNHEVTDQYGLYDNHGAGTYHVIPPGIDIETFYPYYNSQLDKELDDELSRQARMALLHELHRFWVQPEKPFILALCRPDQRKNIAGLIRAYGEDKDLQAIANLAIFAGIRKDINEMEENERNVLTEMLLMMDAYDLYGKLAIPKRHDFSSEVPELYRLCADSRGVFINPALLEPFGLTLIEAASCGVPIVATQNGGPADIIGNCDNGILIDPINDGAISSALRKILVDRDLWKFYSHNGINGVRKHYSWKTHCAKTVKLIKQEARDMPLARELVKPGTKRSGFGKRLTGVRQLLISDIDDTLVGDAAALAQLLELLARRRSEIGLGLATGRTLEAAMAALAKHGIPEPDIMICSVGTEIFYGPSMRLDTGWKQHLSHLWKPALIRQALADLSCLTLQEEDFQQPFKVSYYVDPEKEPELLQKVHQALQAKRLRYQLVYSLGQYLDVLPYRASKGRAVRYLSYKWGIPLPNIMVCGDSGKDAEMLRGDTCGVVVGNYREDLEPLRGTRRIYFSKLNHAAGIIDGLHHYQFTGEG